MYFASSWVETADADSSDWPIEAQTTDRLTESEVTVVSVDGDTFQSLLISNRNLERWDSPNQNTFGLFDPHHRIRYVIGQSELFELQK
jgi:hypothetical protein